MKGTILNGRYELSDRLGEGGMGTVWVARNVAVGGAEVAVKLMHANLTQDATAVGRFRNEAEIAASLGHPNIVRVFDFGETEDGAPFMVMERLHGESLAERLERDGALPAREAAQVVCTVLDALAAAHARDVLHRDLKPENIFLAREGNVVTPKILDFGVSKILGDDATRTRMTRTGAILGTPAYMSPEQVMGPTVDLRSDLWTMGVILYELVTGHLPFDAPNYNAVLVRIATSAPDPIDRHVPGLDGGIVAIIERAMARKPSSRFNSAEQMREALGAWLEGRASEVLTTSPRVPTGDRSTPFVYEQSDTLPGQSLAPPVRTTHHRWIAAGVLATLALAIGVVARNPFARPGVASASLSQPRAMLHVESLPPGARITVDDQTQMLPARLTAADHRVTVTAPGYRPWMQVVSMPAGDVTLRYDGERLPPDAPPPPPPVVAQNPAAPPVVLPAHIAAPHAPSRRSGRATGARNGHGHPDTANLLGGNVDYN